LFEHGGVIRDAEEHAESLVALLKYLTEVRE